MDDLIVDSDYTGGKGGIYEVSIPSAGDNTLEATLYLPGGKGPHSALLFNDGLAKSPKKIEKILSSSFTKKGVALLIPHYLGPEQHRLVPLDVEHVVAAFQFLREQPDVDSENTGMLGFSYGGLLSLIGAADERIADQVRYVISFSGPTDLESLVIYAQSDPRAKRHIKKVVRRSLLESAKGEIQLKEQDNIKDFSVYKDLFIVSEILENNSAFEIVQLLDKLSPSAWEYFERFSPVNRANQIKASVLLIHGKGDRYVPCQQAEIMHKNILDAGGTSKLIVVDGLGHLLTIHHRLEVLSFLYSKGGETLKHIKELLKK